MSDGVSVCKHEMGIHYPGAPELPWIESFNLAPNGGENWMTLNRILPDISGDADAVRFCVLKSNSRNGYATETKTTLRKKNPSGYVDIRETARDMRLRIEMVTESNWGAVGPILVDLKMRGKKGKG